MDGIETENLKDSVWEKATIVEGFEKSMIRKDSCGAWIVYSEYENRNSDFGWEINHVFPKSLGGDDDLINLRPMQWENNLLKGDDYPSYSTAVYADGNENIHMERQLRVNDKLQEALNQRYGEQR